LLVISTKLFQYLRTHMHIYFHLRYIFQMLSSYQKFVLMLWRYRYWETGSLPTRQGISLLLWSLKVPYSLYTKCITYPYFNTVNWVRTHRSCFL